MLANCLLILLLIQKLEKLKNKIPGFSGLVTNTAFDTKSGEIEKNS